MSTHNIPFSIRIRKKHPKSSQICSYGLFVKGLENEFETAVVNEPSVFEPLKFYFIRLNSGMEDQYTIVIQFLMYCDLL